MNFASKAESEKKQWLGTTVLPTVMTLGVFFKVSDYMGFSAFILKIVLSCPLAKRLQKA